MEELQGSLTPLYVFLGQSQDTFRESMSRIMTDVTGIHSAVTQLGSDRIPELQRQVQTGLQALSSQVVETHQRSQAMGQFLWESLQDTRSLYSILDQSINILMSATRSPDSNVIEATSEWRKIVKLQISSIRTDLFRVFDRLNQFDLLSSRLDRSESEIVSRIRTS